MPTAPGSAAPTSTPTVRRYLPKGVDLSKFTDQDLRRVEFILNNTPRKILGFRTPAEVFNQLKIDNMADMAVFSVATGLRQANVKGLDWQYVDQERRHAWIPGSKHKNGKPHSVPLNEMALTVLRKQVGKHPTWIFTFRSEPIQQVNTKAWTAALERAGIEDFAGTICGTPSPPGTASRNANPRAPTVRRLEDRGDGRTLRARSPRGFAGGSGQARCDRRVRDGYATKHNGLGGSPKPLM